MTLTATTIVALGRVRKRMGLDVPSDFIAAGTSVDPVPENDAPNFGISEEHLQLLIDGYRVQYGRDPHPLPTWFKRKYPIGSKTAFDNTEMRCELAIYENAPPWLERWESGDVDYKLTETISLTLEESGRDGAMSWRLVGENANSPATDFFAAARESAIGIEVWADKKLHCVLVHQLPSGEMLAIETDIALVRELLTSAKEGIDGVSSIECFFENSCVQRSKDKREGFSKGRFYVETKTDTGWKREVLFDGRRFVR